MVSRRRRQHDIMERHETRIICLKAMRLFHHQHNETFFLGLFVLVFIINFVCRVFLLATNVIEIKKEEEKGWISIICCVLQKESISLI